MKSNTAKLAQAWTSSWGGGWPRESWKMGIHTSYYCQKLKLSPNLSWLPGTDRPYALQEQTGGKEWVVMPIRGALSRLFWCTQAWTSFCIVMVSRRWSWWIFEGCRPWRLLGTRCYLEWASAACCRCLERQTWHAVPHVFDTREKDTNERHCIRVECSSWVGWRNIWSLRWKCIVANEDDVIAKLEVGETVGGKRSGEESKEFCGEADDYID